MQQLIFFLGILQSWASFVLLLVTWQFMSYADFAPFLLSRTQADKIEYVSQSHPDFEYICYSLGYEVLSVKLSHNENEKFFLIPEAQWQYVLRRTDELRIDFVCVN